MAWSLIVSVVDELTSIQIQSVRPIFILAACVKDDKFYLSLALQLGTRPSAGTREEFGNRIVSRTPASPPS